MNMKKIKYWLKTPASVRRHNQDEYRALEIKYDVLRNEYAHALKRISVELGYYEIPESVCGCMKFLVLEQTPGLKYTTTHACPYFINGVACDQEKCAMWAANNRCAKLHKACEQTLNKKLTFWKQIYTKVK